MHEGFHSLLSSKCILTISYRNGTLQEFITSEVSKEDFLARLKVALEGKYTPPVPQQPQPNAPTSNDTPVSSNSSATAPTPPTVSTQQTTSQRTTDTPRSERPTVQPSTSKAVPRKEDKVEKPKPKQEKPQQTPKVSPGPAKSTPPKPSKKPKEEPKEEPKPKPPVPRGPPKEYRLQVRLFDGSSVRSTFTPKQTIRNEVRSWLDQQMTDDNRPYNLKHILTPLPSRTLSMSEESQTLEELGLGSTANLVMVPVQSFTSAYSASASSLPVRGISAVYNMASSVASSATSFVGSFIGYGQETAPKEPEPQSSSSASAPASNSRNTRSSGLNIRTLHDQQNDGRDSQLYNGNQV